MFFRKPVYILIVFTFLSYISIVQAGYIDNGDGTVYNTGTNLMWQQATAPGVWTWQQADNYCGNLTLASHSDWRLPTIDELSTLYDKSIPPPGPKIDRNFFPDTEASYPYWSSTPEGRPGLMWFLSFDTGPFNLGVMTETYCVRAVRVGQKVSPTTTTTTAPGGSTTTTSIDGATTTTTTTSDGNSCPAKQVLGEDNPHLENLYAFRDNTLAQSAIGRKITQIYYTNADSINAALDRSPALRSVTRGVLEVIAPMVGKN